MSKIFWVGVTGFLLCSGAMPAWSETKSPSAMRAFNQGAALFNQHHCDEAIPLFDDAIERDSDFAEAYYARGACNQSEGRNESAAKDLSDALRLKPTLWDARSLRGALRFQQNQFDDALEDFNAVLEQDPSEAQSLIGRGAIYLKREKFSAAEQDFKSYLKYHPNDSFAPKVHQVLASLKRVTHSSVSNDSNNRPSSDQSGEGHARRASDIARAQAVSASFFSKHQSTADEFNQKVLNGDTPQAISSGDPSQ